MPPKKDAFADLFLSASNGGKQNNLTMLERQRQQQHRALQNLLLLLLLAPKQDSWSNVDFLSNPATRTTSPNLRQQNFHDILYPTQNIASRGVSPSFDGSVISSGNSSTNSFKNEEDPFAIFNTPQPKLKQSNGSNGSDISQSSNRLDPNIGGLSLLDDEYTDVFSAAKEPEPKRTELKRQQPVESPLFSSRGSFSDSQGPSRHPSSQRQSHSSSKADLSRKDSVIAELADIGFSVEDANFAVAKKGLDLQACVNFIMNKNSGGSTPRRETRSKPNEGINFNELGVDLFNRANRFLAKSKDTVIKNIEQFQNQGSHGGSSNLPEWMRDHEKYEKYKSEAVEKKYGHGEAELDYGSDSENVDQQEIERFMRLQKEKEKERAKKRYEDLKETALNKIRGKARDGEPDIPARRDQIPVRPARPVRNPSDQDEPIRRRPVGHVSRNADKSVTPPVQQDFLEVENVSDVKLQVSKPTAQSAPKEIEVDLLGISSFTNSSGLKSSLRDNVPLNQFDEVDYTTAKTAAQEAYRTGDYGGALESYLVCLNKLPDNHEYRVIILSNLGMVNKQVGHLKQSLNNIDAGLALIAEDEIHNSGFAISQKPVKYWYTKLITTKAEVLELLEKYELSLKFYSILIKDLGVIDKKIMDAKRRVDKIVNPDNYKVKSAVKKALPPASKLPSPNIKKAPVEDSQIDALAQDKINTKVHEWAQSKQGNLRSLLTGLDVIIPPVINMKPALRNLTTNELMLPKQVKIQYMKVISSIHPDKLASQCKDNKEAELICNGVFIILNESWEKFKGENSL